METSPIDKGRLPHRETSFFAAQVLPVSLSNEPGIPLHDIQDILLPQRLPRSILTLQQDRPSFQRAEGVPLAGRDVDEGAAGEHVDGFGQHPLVSIPQGII